MSYELGNDKFSIIEIEYILILQDMNYLIISYWQLKEDSNSFWHALFRPHMNKL